MAVAARGEGAGAAVGSEVAGGGGRWWPGEEAAVSLRPITAVHEGEAAMAWVASRRCYFLERSMVRTSTDLGTLLACRQVVLIV
jgi:hypothetical protein